LLSGLGRKRFGSSAKVIVPGGDGLPSSKREDSGSAAAADAEEDVPDASLYTKALDTYNTHVELFMEEQDLYGHFDMRGLTRETDITKQVLFRLCLYFPIYLSIEKMSMTKKHNRKEIIPKKSACVASDVRSKKVRKGNTLQAKTQVKHTTGEATRFSEIIIRQPCPTPSLLLRQQKC
jgi:hypothetical protein